MREWADFDLIEDGDVRVLEVRGPLVISSIGVIDRRLRQFEDAVAAIDISRTTQIDSVGAWVVWRAANRLGAEIAGASEQAQHMLETVEANASSAQIDPDRPALLTRVPVEVGEKVTEFGRGSLSLIGFLGAVLAGFAGIVRHPSRFRFRALVRQMELVGVSSLPIVALMSFLIGIVVAQQGAAQLAQFGAEIFTINLTGRLTLRELGVLMTAIMVAGRSGSAFAAQLGTMRLTEEIDAMRTIGVSPMEVLVIPRILASVLMLPLLGFFAACMAILGGAFISNFTLGIPFWTFLSRIQEVVPLYDLWVGLVKAPVFGLIVALTGCYQGLQVEGNAEEVGLRTTQAVVQAIFMVIVLDAFFAVFFSEIGWV